MPISMKDLQAKRTLDLDSIQKIDKVVETTATEDKPYPVSDNQGNTTILGNPNKVKRVEQEYDLIISVAKEGNPFTLDELNQINIDDELSESDLEYRVHIKVPITEISPERRELASSAVGMVMQLFYREVVEDDEVHYTYITDPLERKARELEILSNPYVTKVLKDSVYQLLDLPVELRNTWVSEAVRVFVEFATNNPDIINEVDANLI